MPLFNLDGYSAARGREKRDTHEFLLTGETDRNAAMILAAASLPLMTAAGLVLNDFGAEEQDDQRGAFLIKATYCEAEKTDNPETKPNRPREISIGISTTQTSATVTHSKATTRHDLSPGRPGPDFNHAMAVDGDGVPQGVDLPFSETAFSVEIEFDTPTLTNNYVAQIEALRDHYNDAPFRGRAAGEVLFAGMNGTIQLDEPTNRLTFDFKVSKNLTNGTIGPFTGIDKLGWQYAWIYSEKEEFASRSIEVPIALYIEDTLEAADLTQTGVQA